MDEKWCERRKDMPLLVSNLLCHHHPNYKYNPRGFMRHSDINKVMADIIMCQLYASCNSAALKPSNGIASYLIIWIYIKMKYILTCETAQQNAAAPTHPSNLQVFLTTFNALLKAY